MDDERGAVPDEVRPVVWAGLKPSVEGGGDTQEGAGEPPAGEPGLEAVGRVAERLALAAVLATSLSSALGQPPRTDLVGLPEPTPIVRTFESMEEGDVDPADDEAEDETSRRRRLLRLLRMLALALLLVASLVIGTLKGCASCAVSPFLLPGGEQREEVAADGEGTAGEREGQAGDAVADGEGATGEQRQGQAEEVAPPRN